MALFLLIRVFIDVIAFGFSSIVICLFKKKRYDLLGVVATGVVTICIIKSNVKNLTLSSCCHC